MSLWRVRCTQLVAVGEVVADGVREGVVVADAVCDGVVVTETVLLDVGDDAPRGDPDD